MNADDMNEFIDLFRQESAERFEALEHDLLQLETDPSNRETINSILRSVHSLKGSAGMFGHDRLKTVAHRLEDLLQYLNEHPERLNANAMDILLQGRDLMQALFRNITGNNDMEDESSDPEEFLVRLEAVRTELEQGSLVSNDELRNLLDMLEASLPFAAGVIDPDATRELIQTIRARDISTPGKAGSLTRYQLGGQEITDLAEQLTQHLEAAILAPLSESEATGVFDAMEHLLQAAEAETNPALEEAIREGKETVSELRELEIDFDDVPALCLSRILESLLEHASCHEDTTGNQPTETGAEQDQTQRVVSLQNKAVRISEDKLDGFLNNVGELIILAEVFNNLQKRVTSELENNMDLAREISSNNVLLAKHVFDLQEALMDVRRVELRHLTGGLERLVRDTARRQGRQVAFEVIGDEVSIDKSLLEQINTCLVHLLRNAIDHGIGPPEDRIARGKDPTGRISVTATSEGGQLVLSIADDGRGISHERLLARAVERGVCSRAEAEQMSESEALRLIFNDGLSTAETISEVSGRGVGMGAVMESIERAGGSIDIDTTLGEGTTVILHIPLSIMLSVVDGLVVRAAGQNFVIPIRHVEESLALTRKSIQTVTGRGETVQVRDMILPVRRLRELLRLSGTRNESDRHVGIVVCIRRGKACLLADEILDHQQVVIKRIPGLTRVRGVRGGALLGDGTIGLVLDVESLAID